MSGDKKTGLQSLVSTVERWRAGIGVQWGVEDQLEQLLDVIGGGGPFILSSHNRINDTSGIMTGKNRIILGEECDSK